MSSQVGTPTKSFATVVKSALKGSTFAYNGVRVNQFRDVHNSRLQEYNNVYEKKGEYSRTTVE